MVMGSIFAWHCYCHAIVVHCVRLNSFFSLTLLFGFVFLLLFYLNKCSIGIIHVRGQREMRMCICSSIYIYCAQHSLGPEILYMETFCILRRQLLLLHFHCIFVILLLSFDNRHRSISALCCLFLIIIFFLFYFSIGFLHCLTTLPVDDGKAKMCPFVFVSSKCCFSNSCISLVRCWNYLTEFLCLLWIYYCGCLSLCIHSCVNVSISTCIRHVTATIKIKTKQM